MILEVAVLQVLEGQEHDFEQAFSTAQHIIARQKGYLRHQLQHCLENPRQYLLLVEWETLTDHTVGFRQGADYPEWKALLHHFYHPFPVVEHYTAIEGLSSGTAK